MLMYFSELERQANLPQERRLRLSNPDVQYAIYMIEKYGEDYKVSSRSQTTPNLGPISLVTVWYQFKFNGKFMLWFHHRSSGASLTKAYDVTIQRYRNSHAKIEDSKMHILRCMGSKFCVKFQRCPLKFHTKFWTHTPQNMNVTRC